MSLGQATPIKLIKADHETISATYFLSGGIYDGKVVLVSSIAKYNYDETAIFICNDMDGEDVEWDALIKIYEADLGKALIGLGYNPAK